MWIFKFLLVIVIISIILLVAGLNVSETVDLELLFQEYQDVSLVLVIIVSFILGMFGTLIISIFRELQLRSQLRKEKNLRINIERELTDLKNQLPKTEIEEEARLKDFTDTSTSNEV